MNIKRFIAKLEEFIKNNRTTGTTSQKLLHLQLENQLNDIKNQLARQTPAAPINSGFSVYSQNDEDGILQNIFNRLGIDAPLFFEFGVAPEENNTNYLLLKGSKGCWVDKGLTRFKQQVQPNQKLLIVDDFITLENIVDIIQTGCRFLNIPTTQIDLISLDLDGNDYYFIEKLLQQGIMPKVFCLEYNAVFRPPLDVKTKYSASHCWTGDDYFGCSLMAYYDLLLPHYKLVSCNIPGSNCFFVHHSFAAAFDDINYTVEQLYQPPRYWHSPYTKGHAPSARFVLDYVNAPQQA